MNEEDRENQENKNSQLLPNMIQSEHMQRFHLLCLTRLRHGQEHKLLMAATLQKQLDLYEQNKKKPLSSFAFKMGIEKKDTNEHVHSNQFPTSQWQLSTGSSSASLPTSPCSSSPQPLSNLNFSDLAIHQSRKTLPLSINASGLTSIASASPSRNTIRMKPPKQQWKLDYQREVELQKELDVQKATTERPVPKKNKDHSLQNSSANAA